MATEQCCPAFRQSIGFARICIHGHYMHFAAFFEAQKQEHVNGARGREIPTERNHIIIRVGIIHFKRVDQWACMIIQQLSNCAANLTVLATMEIGFPVNQDRTVAGSLCIQLQNGAAFCANG